MNEYKLISEKKKKFNEEVKKLIDQGFVPYGELIVSFRKTTYDDESYFLYSQTFIYNR